MKVIGFFNRELLMNTTLWPKSEGFAVIDGTSAIEEQQAQVRGLVKGIIPKNQRKILETEQINIGVPA